MFIQVTFSVQKIVKTWDLEEIKTKSKLFKSEMKEAIVSKKKIVTKAIVRFESFPTPEDPRLFELEKYYRLHSIASNNPSE